MMIDKEIEALRRKAEEVSRNTFCRHEWFDLADPFLILKIIEERELLLSAAKRSLEWLNSATIKEKQELIAQLDTLVSRIEGRG